MDPEIKVEFNPWDVPAPTTFSFFCCPECSFREQNLPEFINHAAWNHPLSKEFCKTSSKFQITTTVEVIETKAALDTDLMEDNPFEPVEDQEDDIKPKLMSSLVNDDSSNTSKPAKRDRKQNLKPLDYCEIEFDTKEPEIPKKRKCSRIRVDPDAGPKERMRWEKFQKNGEPKSVSDINLSCTICQKSFADYINLALHNMDNHQDEANILKCPSCNYITNTEDEQKTQEQLKFRLKDHVHANHNQICSECNELVREDRLWIHMKFHEVDTMDVGPSDKRRWKVYLKQNFKGAEPSEVNLTC